MPQNEKNRHHLSQKTKPYGPLRETELDAIDKLRREIDEIEKLDDGFTVLDNGVFGVIYFREKNKVLEIVFEYWDKYKHEVLMDPKGLDHWILPAGESIDGEARKRIEALLIKWVSDLNGSIRFSTLVRLFKNDKWIGMLGDPDGGDTTRVYEPASDEERKKATLNRRKKDGVPNLEQGFTERSSGRSGMFYYREGDKILEFGWEYSDISVPGGILISPEAFHAWFYPTTELINSDKKEEIKDKFVRMIRAQRGTPIFSNQLSNVFSLTGFHKVQA